jgi:hypothetical protein
MEKKKIEFDDFVKVANLMEKGIHLTEQGLKKIEEIKNGMNIGRK